MITTGNALTVLRTLPSGHFDGCLTDPPYGLSFMGKHWDHGVPGPELWSAVLRVLKPGAFILAFGGTRTHHRLACAIEDAGFEIRDCMVWMYGSGFPKSLDISKAIDRHAGAKRKITGTWRPTGTARIKSNGNSGHGYEHGELRTVLPLTAPATAAAKTWDGYGTALKPAWEPIIVAMKPLDGTFANNAMKHGVAGLAIDAARIPTLATLRGSTVKNDMRGGNFGNGHRPNPGDISAYVQSPLGRWPANVIFDEDAGAQLDASNGTLTSGLMAAGTPRNNRMGYSGAMPPNTAARDTYGDSGGASRFFYCAKASRKERGEGNTHPTVKPIKLTEYLARLILPPARSTPRRLLVPFCGSGSEMIGARKAGWDEMLGIESEPAYVRIARKRLAASA